MFPFFFHASVGGKLGTPSVGALALRFQPRGITAKKSEEDRTEFVSTSFLPEAFLIKRSPVL